MLQQFDHIYYQRGEREEYTEQKEFFENREIAQQKKTPECTGSFKNVWHNKSMDLNAF